MKGSDLRGILRCAQDDAEAGYGRLTARVAQGSPVILKGAIASEESYEGEGPTGDPSLRSG
jgi:hypothetical protein